MRVTQAQRRDDGFIDAGSVYNGECFEHENRIYMKVRATSVYTNASTDPHDVGITVTEGYVIAVNLKSGTTRGLLKSERVRLVKTDLKVIDYYKREPPKVTP